MRKTILPLLLLININLLFSQEANAVYDEKLAKSLNADEHGMKQYIFCILKTGTNTNLTADEKSSLFMRHMTNITKMAQEGKLVVAGPFMKNDRNYRGLYIFNVATVEEAQALVATDPAVKNNLLEAELMPWYGSAALMETVKLHDKIAKIKF